MTANESGLQVEVHDHVLILRLARPERRNAIDLPTASEIESQLDRFEADDRLRCAVLSGVGPTFCSGMDLKAVAQTRERPITARRGAFGIVGLPLSKPIIAAVHGAVLGGGLEIALACDLIVSHGEAFFGLPEVRRGQVAGAGGAVRIGQRLPRTVAADLLLTGEPITARRAYELGLVSRLVDSDVEAAAFGIARTIADNAPLAVSASKELLGRSLDWSQHEALKLQETIVSGVRSSQDAAEGIAAFTAGRAPVWTGS